MSTGIRAREAVAGARCPFLADAPCTGCGHGDGVGDCGLLADVPAGEDPRDFYVRHMAALAAETGGGR